MTHEIMLLVCAILVAVVIFYFINRYARSHPLSRKEERMLEEIAKDD